MSTGMHKRGQPFQGRVPALLFALVLLALPMVSACASTDDPALASHLKKISKALNSTVVFKNAPEGLSEQELLKLSTEHDPTLMEPFKDYAVRVRRIGKATSVLLCDARRREAILEDTSCTADFDLYVRRDHPGSSCDFVLDIVKLCSK